MPALTLGNWLMVIFLTASLAVSGWFLLAAVAMTVAQTVFEIQKERTHTEEK